MQCILRSCARCRGDLVLDDCDWRCLQCAQYYYGDTANLVGESYPIYPFGENDQLLEEALSFPENVPGALDRPTDSINEGGSQRKRRTAGFKTRAARSINSVIKAKFIGEARWWARNQNIIEYLDQGLSVLNVSLKTDCGQRQVRTVRERLADLRAEASVK